MSRETARSFLTILEFYQALGFERLPLREVTEAILSSCRPAAAAGVRPGTKEEQLRGVREDIGECRRCRLHEGRTHIVFGEGDAGAAIMFIGEGPGREEDLQGRPFVGDAGQVLTRLIERMGLKRSEVYIGNVVKCRPPMNRDPQEDEIATCIPFLRRQIEIIGPEVIVSLGRISAHSLIGAGQPMSKFSITKARGQFFEYPAAEKAIPLMPTFHPAYLLRNPKEKWSTWEDAQAVLRRIGRTVDADRKTEGERNR